MALLRTNSLWNFYTPVLRLIPSASCKPLVFQRMMNSASDEFLVDKNCETGVATFKLNKKPVNSFNTKFLCDMTEKINSLEQDKDCTGIIFTSNFPGIFSAGLDILEMYGGKESNLRVFWSNLQDFWIKLYGCQKPTVAAINGHSPAGGCMLALSCDYRVMATGKFTIGLNETLLGIVAPPFFQRLMKDTIGQRETERALELGYLYSTEEALNFGLVDKLVAPEKVQEEAEAVMSNFLKIPDSARHLSKMGMRSDALNALISKKQEDIDYFVNFIQQPGPQKAMGLYLQSLKKKASKS